MPSSKSKIEWTESTWNPVRGCTRVSKGCENCYAERTAARFATKGNPYYGFAKFVETKNGKEPRWTNKVEVVSKHLIQPLRWTKPRLIFVNSMSDLFHEKLPFEDIQIVFDVMNAADHHTYQVLTKRHERLLELSSKLEWGDHIWMGVSVEDKQTVKRLDFLKQTDAKIKFCSAEPLIEDISTEVDKHLDWLDWIIVGGESGPYARPMDPRWAIDIWKQSINKPVAFFFKQYGGVKDKRVGKLIVDGKEVINEYPDVYGVVK